MSRGCHLTIQYDKHEIFSSGKALTAYSYKLTLLNFMVRYHWKSKSIGRDPTYGPYHIYGYLPNAHLIYNKEIKISTAHVVS